MVLIAHHSEKKKKKKKQKWRLDKWLLGITGRPTGGDNWCDCKGSI